jgi:hypothetical protein
MRAARLFAEPQIVIEKPIDWYLVHARATRDRDSICVQQPRGWSIPPEFGAAGVSEDSGVRRRSSHRIWVNFAWVKFRQDGDLNG